MWSMIIHSKSILWTIVLMASGIKNISGKIQLEESYSPNVPENMRLYPMLNPTLPMCRNPNFLNQPYICQLVNRVKNSPRISSSPPYSPSQDYLIDTPTNLQARSYYGSFGHGAPAAPTFYPTFDPISVLASLAFLAFLLQSFASLFDRSRSIIPTVVSSSRHSSPEIDEDIEERVMRALDEYVDLQSNFLNENKEAAVTKTKSSIKR